MLNNLYLFLWGILLATHIQSFAQDNLRDDDTETGITVPDEDPAQKAKPVRTQAKSEKNGFQAKNLFFGIGGGASFQNNYNYWSISPMVGYQFSKLWAAGLQMSYSKAREYIAPDQTFTSFGVMPFTRFFLAENFFLQAEYQYSSWTLKDNTGNKNNYTFSVPFLGIGYIIPLGESLKIVGLVRYALADPANPRNPYRNSPLQYNVFFQF